MLSLQTVSWDTVHSDSVHIGLTNSTLFAKSPSAGSTQMYCGVANYIQGNDPARGHFWNWFSLQEQSNSYAGLKIGMFETTTFCHNFYKEEKKSLLITTPCCVLFFVFFPFFGFFDTILKNCITREQNLKNSILFSFYFVLRLFHRSIVSQDERDPQASGMQIRWHSLTSD